jgi:hypothetical protein
VDSRDTPRHVQVAITEAQIKIIAQLKLSGIKNEEVAKQLGLTVYQVRKVEEREEFKFAIKDLADDMVRTAASMWKGAMGKLIPKALAALEKGLDAGKIDAVKVVLTTLGLDKMENTPNTGTLQIVLPDYQSKKETVIDVTKEV